MVTYIGFALCSIYSARLQIHSEPYEVAAMATETPDQSASLAEVSRRIFTDLAG